MLLAVALVALSLDRDMPDAYPVTSPAPSEVGDALVGPEIVTIDASRENRWVYFDFSRGSVVERPGPTGWDLAFRRFEVMANGGAAFAGAAGVLDLGDVPLDSLRAVPATGYETTPPGRDSTNPVIARWYDYGFTSHLLTPKQRTWAIRTADGRYAALRFLSYYCPGATPGCVTLRYVYQGGGSAEF